MVSFVIGSGGLQVHGGLAVTEEERRYCPGLPLALYPSPRHHHF
jgi:hypothetical protein